MSKEPKVKPTNITVLEYKVDELINSDKEINITLKSLVEMLNKVDKEFIALIPKLDKRYVKKDEMKLLHRKYSDEYEVERLDKHEKKIKWVETALNLFKTWLPPILLAYLGFDHFTGGGNGQ